MWNIESAFSQLRGRRSGLALQVRGVKTHPGDVWNKSGSTLHFEDD